MARLGEPADTRDLYALLQGHGPVLAEVGFQSLATIAAASGTRLAATVAA
jgi:hypothetical protein